MASTLPSAQETPFEIQISDESIQLLKQKLELTRFPDELEDAGRDYGVPLADIQRLVARWKDGYDWRLHEKQLNEDLPQFKRDIQVDGFGTLGIHYIHKKSDVPGAIPLLFVHGWPGSFLEVKKILPLLVKASSPDDPSFHVVTLSMPGYGFSDAPKKSGFGISQYAEVGHKLMLFLGYEQYVTQGGDWGYRTTRRIACLYGGKYSKAWHSNVEFRQSPRLLSHPISYLSYLFSRYTPTEQADLERMNWFHKRGTGYSQEQSTQPQTLGYGLADSPAGLLAWIYEKLVNWSDAYPWEDDEVLTWISIYWFSTAGPTASTRIYYERVKESEAAGNIFGMERTPPTIPHGYSRFPQELALYPRSWVRDVSPVFEAEHDGGGHFAAHEKPDELVGDLRKMFGKGGPAFGVVDGHTGYGERVAFAGQ